MGKKVLAIIGSPRKNGNTDALIDVILSSAKDAGAETEKVYLIDCNIANCVACGFCQKDESNTCVVKDDMYGLIEKMEEADVWVFGTPVYWWGPTGLFKSFMDRWYGFNVDFKSKQIIVAYPQEDPDKEVGRHLRGMFEDALDYKGVKAFAYIQAAGAANPGDIEKLTDVLEYAKQVGANCIK